MITICIRVNINGTWVDLTFETAMELHRRLDEILFKGAVAREKKARRSRR